MHAQYASRKKFFFLQIGWFLVLGGFRAWEIDWRKSRVPKKFFWPPMGVPHVKKSIFSTFLFWLQIGWFLVLGGFRAREIDWRKSQFRKIFHNPLNFWAKIQFLRKKLDFWEKLRLKKFRGLWKFFWTRDLRQSISRARKPPSTKNQPIWSQNKKVEKIDFFKAKFYFFAKGSIYSPRNMVKEAFSCFENVRNRFPA
jgi:hypothetical protein